MKENILTFTDFQEIPLKHRGKVRDIYDLGKNLLIVATDRLSAFDVVLPDGIPYKGLVLNQLSAYWFNTLADIIPHHMVTINLQEAYGLPPALISMLTGRAMIVKKAKPLPVECVVRGYLSGSAWNEYQEKGMVCGIPLPPGLKESAKLDQPIFTPATKSEIGSHDENIDFSQVIKILGANLAERVRQASLQLYQRAVSLAEQKGIIIADTKFEFGLDEKGELLLIDEALTPDSSRFWPQEEYIPGQPQKSFDKQFVRDYLLSLNWNKKPPAPHLPAEVIKKTSEKYLEAYARITGQKLVN
ncbi:MAG: phosphoribosylaminoimidazolesuccinocarboxamide synthase [Thermodesulfobacteriota bacterium]